MVYLIRVLNQEKKNLIKVFNLFFYDSKISSYYFKEEGGRKDTVFRREKGVKMTAPFYVTYSNVIDSHYLNFLLLYNAKYIIIVSLIFIIKLKI